MISKFFLRALPILRRVWPGNRCPALLRLLGAVVGLALCLAGYLLACSEVQLSYEPPAFASLLVRHVQHGRTVLAAGALLVGGGCVAAWSLRRLASEPLSALPLPTLGQVFARGTRPCFVAGSLLYAGLIWHVLGGGRGFLGGALLLLSLVAFALSIHLRDPRGVLPWRRTDLWWTMIVFAATVAVNCVELSSWQFAWIGDEGEFFEHARRIATGGDFSLFSLRGVYQTHPVADSVYQGLIMRLAGVDILGWRLAEVLVLAVAATLVYLIAVLLFGRLPALLAASMFGSSHFLMAFTRIAYNNTHIFIPNLLVVLTLLLAYKTQRGLFVFLTGCAMGLSLYTFMAGQLLGPVLALFLLTTFRRPWRHQGSVVALMLAGFVLVIVPGLLSTPIDHLINTALTNSRREAAAQTPGLVFRLSLLHSTVAFWVNRGFRYHYVGAGLMDPVGAVLLPVGVLLAALRWRLHAARLFLLWLVGGLLMLSATSYIPGPLHTRLLFLMPPAVLLVAMAVAAFLRSADRVGRVSGYLGRAALVLAVVVVPFANLHQLLVVSPTRTHRTWEVMIMKALQTNPQHVIVGVAETLDQTRLNMVRRYPWLRDRYRQEIVDKLELPPLQEGPAGNLPIYLVTDNRLADRVLAQLPRGYRAETVRDDAGSRHIWLLRPSAEVARPAPPADVPRFRQPVERLVIRLPDAAEGGTLDPRDVSVGPDGSIAVLTAKDGLLRIYDQQGRLQRTLDPAAAGVDVVELFAVVAVHNEWVAVDAGGARLLWLSTHGEVVATTESMGYYPRGVSFDGKSLLVADTGGARIVEVVGHDELHALVKERGSAPGQVHEPTDVVRLPSGRMVVFDAGNERLQWLGVAGTPLLTVDVPSDFPARESGRVAVDRHGRVLVTHPPQHRVLVFDGTGTLMAHWPQGGASPPVGIFVDPDDQVYVTYPKENVVRVFTPPGAS